MRAPDASDSRQQAFLRAAAVLWYFDLDSLEPDSDEPARKGEATALLQPFVARLRIPGGDRWTLRDALRPELLGGADASELARLRARNRAIGSPEQKLVDRWLIGPDPDLAEYRSDDLAVVSRVRGWFDQSVAGHFPSTSDLEHLRALALVREPLLALMGTGFRGRKFELGELRAFVFDPPAAPTPAILVVYGIGGTGKSTLVGRFLLDILAGGDSSHLVAYLDFDSPTLNVGDGVSLMLPILDQCAAQRPDLPALADLARRAGQATVDLAGGPDRAPGRSLACRASMEELASSLGDVQAAAGGTRLTLVFDTFEEAQYANTDHLRQLLEQLAVLHERVAGLHTIVVTRSRLELTGAEYLEVGDLDDEAARLFLDDRGIHDEQLILRTLQVARGNPLSLKLAAAMLLRSGVAGLHGLEGGNHLEQELIQGQLYQRILQHVHRVEIQRLAHPGLVVRRVTADIIRNVLAEPCGLGIIDEDQADELFSSLEREVSLVRVAADGALEHRPDVRRVMLRLLYRDRPGIARRIHERAADYYRRLHDDIAIAEEAYHRFALGETEGPWLSRLTPDAAARLRTAFDELPEGCWPTLASYAGIDLPEEQWRSARAADRERRVAGRVEELLQADRAEEAVKVLAESPPGSPSSVLWRWQGRALRLVGRLPEALVALERALATLAGPAAEAARDLESAIGIAEKLGDAESLARLAPNRSSGSRGAAQAYPRAVRPEVGTSIRLVRSAVPWLDDEDFRTVVRAAIAAPDSDAGHESFGLESSLRDTAPSSTRASAAYARAVRLNQHSESPTAGRQLLGWVGMLNQRSGDLESIHQLLKSRLV